MGFKINVDRFGFAKKPEPEKVSRDYAAEYAKSLVEKEASTRNARDTELYNMINAESNARRTDKSELGERINEETSLRTAEDAELKEYIDDCVAAEATLRRLGLDSIGRDLEQEAAARADEDATIRGRLNRLTDQERDARIAADNALGERIDTKADKTDTLAGYGIEDAYTKKEVDGKIASSAVDLSNYLKIRHIDDSDVSEAFDISEKCVLYIVQELDGGKYFLMYCETNNIPMQIFFRNSYDDSGRLKPYCSRIGTFTNNKSSVEWGETIVPATLPELNDAVNWLTDAQNNLGSNIRQDINNIRNEFNGQIGEINDKIDGIDSVLDEIIALQVEKGGDAE